MITLMTVHEATYNLYENLIQNSSISENDKLLANVLASRIGITLEHQDIQKVKPTEGTHIHMVTRYMEFNSVVYKNELDKLFVMIPTLPGRPSAKFYLNESFVGFWKEITFQAPNIN